MQGCRSLSIRVVRFAVHGTVDLRISLIANTRSCLPPNEWETVAAILVSLHMRTADALFGTSQGSPKRDKLIAGSIQWAKKIMEKIDSDGR